MYGFYTQRLAEIKDDLSQLQKKYIRLSVIRLAVFISGLAFFILSFQWHILIPFVFFYLFVYGFGRLLHRHDAVNQELEIHKRLIEINKNEILLIDYDFRNTDPGAKYLDDTHPYSNDMDVFGEASLFAYYNRCSTNMGKNRLATYFIEQISHDIIKERQASSLELESKLAWRQRFQARGYDMKENDLDIQLLQKWLQSDNQFYGDKTLKYLSILVPILCIFAFFIIGYFVSWSWALLAFLPNAYFLYRYNEAVTKIQHFTNRSEDILSKYGSLIELVEQEEFTSPLLKKQHHLFTHKGRASIHIKKLSKATTQLNVRLNIFGLILNLLSLWDLHWVRKLETWKVRYGTNLTAWFDALAEIEALQSIATIGYNHPSWNFATLHSDQKITGKSIGHLLIPEKDRVTNDFESSTSHHLKLITGSNMAGKSTFLRTIGVQIVLTNAGSRLCVEHFALPEIGLFSSMRTKDALRESVSGFYAELRRLKTLLELLESRTPVFYLLDEILKGTNTRDRTKGAKALIKQLLEYPSAGMISTHDLSLGELENQLKEKMENLCFEVKVEGEELIFDYKLKKGISQSFNATELMRKIGINV